MRNDTTASTTGTRIDHSRRDPQRRLRGGGAGLQEIEQPVAALVEAGLTPELAVETYGAISVHTRGSVVLERLQNKTVAGRGVGFADDIDFDYILDSILDNAAHLISPSTPSP